MVASAELVMEKKKRLKEKGIWKELFFIFYFIFCWWGDALYPIHGNWTKKKKEENGRFERKRERGGQRESKKKKNNPQEASWRNLKLPFEFSYPPTFTSFSSPSSSSYSSSFWFFHICFITQLTISARRKPQFTLELRNTIYLCLNNTQTHWSNSYTTSPSPSRPTLAISNNWSLKKKEKRFLKAGNVNNQTRIKQLQFTNN